jgi:hypothetical protein
MTKPPSASLTQVEFVNDGEIDLHDRHYHHLGEPGTWFEYEVVGTPIPAGNK